MGAEHGSWHSGQGDCQILSFSILSPSLVAAVVTLGTTATASAEACTPRPLRAASHLEFQPHPRSVAGGQLQGGHIFYSLVALCLPQCPRPPKPPKLGQRWNCGGGGPIPELHPGAWSTCLLAFGPMSRCLNHTPLRDPRGSAPPSPPSTEPSPHPSNSAQSGHRPALLCTALHWMDPGAFPNARRMPLPLIFPQRAEASPPTRRNFCR